MQSRWRAWIFVCLSAWSVFLPAGECQNNQVSVAVVDENGAPVPAAQVTVQEATGPALHLTTDYRGTVSFQLTSSLPYKIQVQKSGFYAWQDAAIDASLGTLRVVIAHEQMFIQQVSVTASAPTIDPDQVSDRFTLDVPEVVNVPYPTSRDIRNLLPFFPGVVQDATGQVHVAGSETWATLDLLNKFDIRSPISGELAMRFSADAVRSIDEETTRYPVQYGRNTGGVIAFYTGMGDNKFRYNATNFIPSFREANGLRFDKFVPRVTFSGPIARDRAWFHDGVELEYDDVYVKELPAEANTNHLIRGSNLFAAQVNLASRNILLSGFLVNGYHSPYDGLSSLVPQQSTTENNITAWLPYVRDQHTFRSGALLDVGIGLTRFHDSYDPHPGGPFELTPELSQGSYFEGLSSTSRRIEGNGLLYFPAARWMGKHELQAGIDLDHIRYTESYRRAPVNYLREDRTLLRQSTFPATSPFTRHNVEAGAWMQDRWSPRVGVLIEPGLRLDWDEIVRRALISPRIAVVYAPAHAVGATKISAGIGTYYEHTQLEYLARAMAGTRIDTEYTADGVTPIGPPQTTQFLYDPKSLREARAINWSVGVEQKLPGAIYLKANLIRKRVSDEFVYSAPASLYGDYILTTARVDNDTVTEVEARRTFSHNYTLFAAYTHSTAHTNAALDYTPTVSILGPQQPGPLGWDTPNRILSWGWLPFAVPWFRKNWDFVYSFDRHTGFPFTAIDANHAIAGRANAQRFPHYTSFSPGLEWRFHFRGMYLGLRGVLENATGSTDPAVVNSNIDSPEYGMFTEPLGRAMTARIRLIESKK